MYMYTRDTLKSSVPLKGLVILSFRSVSTLESCFFPVDKDSEMRKNNF